MTLPPALVDALQAAYGADSAYRPYAFALTACLFLSFFKGSRRWGCGGMALTVVLYFIITWMSQMLHDFTPQDDDKRPAATARR
jgi:hypothetical protein